MSQTSTERLRDYLAQLPPQSQALLMREFERAIERGEDVAVVCAGYKGAFALDDAYCAGRIVGLLEGDRTDAALVAVLVARAFPDALTGLNARTYGPPGLEADIEFCAREGVLDVVPRFAGRIGGAAEIVA